MVQAAGSRPGLPVELTPREDPWLAGIFGYPVYAVDGPEALPSADRTFCYAKVPVDDVARVRALSAQGFFVVDVNVTLTFDGAGSRRPRGEGVAVVPARPEHDEALIAIAGSCFRYSRFHLDPAIPNEVADRVKREWVRSYLEGRRGIELLAALEGADPVGFLAVLEADDARVIDLIGVAREAQGRGIGGALVEAFVERHAGRTRELRVGTQIANVPSLALYEGCGFAIATAAFVLHRHVGRA